MKSEKIQFQKAIAEGVINGAYKDSDIDCLAEQYELAPEMIRLRVEMLKQDFTASARLELKQIMGDL